MNDATVSKVVIVGGGTAGWMTAAALAKCLGNKISIILVESDAIGTVGVGEATVPHLRYFNQVLGINEKSFMRETSATFKLGIEFINWGEIGNRYIHPFGIFGEAMGEIPFHQYWLKAKNLGIQQPIEEFSIGAVLARQQRFAYPDVNPDNLLSKYGYAFHIDANRYAQFLRRYSEARNVSRVEGRVVDVVQSDYGITAIKLDDGSLVEGDFFVDCSGFRALLIEQTLNTGFDDWSHWLICDRAVAIPSSSLTSPLPYTKATALPFGWQWKIPLQHRVGNGVVYSSRFANDEQAYETLLQSLQEQGSEALAEPNFLKFMSGRRKLSWNKNCVAIGLSSGFLEPLESTSIYLIQIAIMKLVEFFPLSIEDQLSAQEFNREMAREYERIRDFLILHYHITQREDSEFWRYCKHMEVPDSLARKISLFAQQGHIEKYTRGMFLEPSWVAVYLGQGLVPQNYHPSVDAMDEAALMRQMQNMQQHFQHIATRVPTHHDFLQTLQVENDNLDWPPAAMSLYGVFS